MEQSKKEFLPLLQSVKLSKTQSPTTAENRKRMKVIPYASAIGYIRYAMLYTTPDVCLATYLAKRVQEWSRSGSLDNGQNYPQWNKYMFLGYGGDKNFVVKGYVDASFDTDPDDSKSQWYILKVGAIS